MNDQEKRSFNRMKGWVIFCSIIFFSSIFFLELLAELWSDSIVVFLFIGFGAYVVAQIGYLMSKYPYEMDAFPEARMVQSANRYNIIHENGDNFIAEFTDSIQAERYEYIGDIENPFNARMSVYFHDPELKRVTILLIEAEQFTMEMLLEHRRLYQEFLADYWDNEKLVIKEWGRWIKRLHTVLIVQEISAPLYILLITVGMHGNQLNGQIAPVYAFVEAEKKLYTKAHKEDAWLKKHILGSKYRVPEIAWEVKDWEDAFFTYWSLKEPSAAYRYKSSDPNTSDFIERVKNNIISEGYEYEGNISYFDADISVYTLSTENDIETLVFIEAESISSQFLLEHRFVLGEFMSRHRNDLGKKWFKGIRLIIGVRKMTPELQILLCSQVEYERPTIYYNKPNSPEVPQIFAYVEEEKKYYTMEYPPGSFYDEINAWIEKHIIGPQYGDPEIVWEKLKWDELAVSPKDKKEMVVMVHKALNVSKDSKRMGEEMEKDQ